ncbi:MAG: hypothetical protein JNK11_02830 [Alphaproteobacteria bacterium]|nr:hypothetical protein [Alphaproteobacteria bacterium]
MSGQDDDAAIIALRATILARKAAGRRERAALSWSDKLALIERLRERDAPFKANRERLARASVPDVSGGPDDADPQRRGATIENVGAERKSRQGSESP